MVDEVREPGGRWASRVHLTICVPWYEGRLQMDRSEHLYAVPLRTLPYTLQMTQVILLGT